MLAADGVKDKITILYNMLPGTHLLERLLQTYTVAGNKYMALEQV